MSTALEFYYHPLASFCHKVLIALYEKNIPFTGRIVDLADENHRAALMDMWPVGYMPVLKDLKRDMIVPESTIMIEYLDQFYGAGMLPVDPALCLEARLWDRVFDLYVHHPMQTFVLNRLRPESARDQLGLEAAKARLMTAYGMIDRQLAGKTWAIGDSFGLADCAAAPALFYAGIIQPFPSEHRNLIAYFERLLTRPSFARVLVEAQPYFHFFPYNEQMPERFRKLGQ